MVSEKNCAGEMVTVSPYFCGVFITYNNGQNQLSNSCPSLIRKKPWFFVSLWDTEKRLSFLVPLWGKQKTYPIKDFEKPAGCSVFQSNLSEF